MKTVDPIMREDVARALGGLTELRDAFDGRRRRARTRLQELGLDPEGALTASMDWACVGSEPDAEVAAGVLCGLAAGLKLAHDREDARRRREDARRRLARRKARAADAAI